MTDEWEKQILAYCMRVSRGIVVKGMIKMSVFDDTQAQLLGGVTAVHLVDIISYIMRLQKNLPDPVRRRGFGCSIEVGSKVEELLLSSGYDIHTLHNFTVSPHDGYAHEIKFCFTYEPQMAPAMAFEDMEIDEQKKTEDYTQEDQNLEALIQGRMTQEYSEFDDLLIFRDPDEKQESEALAEKQDKGKYKN